MSSYKLADFLALGDFPDNPSCSTSPCISRPIYNRCASQHSRQRDRFLDRPAHQHDRIVPAQADPGNGNPQKLTRGVRDLEISGRFGTLRDWCRTAASCSRGIPSLLRTDPFLEALPIGSRGDRSFLLTVFAVDILLRLGQPVALTLLSNLSVTESHEACPGVRPLYNPADSSLEGNTGATL